jgi:fatty acid desaturase
MTADLRTSRAAALTNLCILVMAGAACIACLWVASHAESILVRVLTALCFSFVANTMFALMHEAVHGGFHPSKAINEFAGRIAAAFFPTAFSLQRAFHLAHHRNNRSDTERFDYYSKDDSYILKVLQWYGILTGIYWATTPIFCIFYALTAGIVSWPKVFPAGSRFARQTSAQGFLDVVEDVPLTQVRLDVATTILGQLLIIWVLDISLLAWCLCYGLFALNWSSLQYADHAFSPLDRREGAWNLKVNSVVRLLFLNYHYHIIHHRDPSIAWRNLPKVAKVGDPTIAYWRMLLCMWAGPRPLPDRSIHSSSSRAVERSSLEALIVNLVISLAFGTFLWLLYGSGSWAYQTAYKVYFIDFPLEREIPFVPWASFIYFSIVLLLALPPILLKTPERFAPLVATAAFEVLVSWFVFVILPVAQPVSDHVVTGLSGMLFLVADALNLEGNSFPSLHVALSVTVGWACAEGRSVITRLAFVLWVGALCASTLFTHQNYLLDVMDGVVLAAFAMAVVHPRLARRLILDLEFLKVSGGASVR